MSHILITGASSGLGAALAETYAEAGQRLSLLGRDAQRLEAVAERCRNRGSQATAYSQDLREAGSTSALLRRLFEETPLDLLIANAGISGGTSGETEDEEQTRAIFETNVSGTLNTVLPLLPLFERRRQGHIVLISSLAGLHGMPGAPAYSASKGTLRLWAEGLRPALAAKGIALTLVCPGFIATPMTEKNAFRMPFLLSAKEAAERIRKGIGHKKARIAFPFPLALTASLLAALPKGLTDAVYARLPKKGTQP